MGLSPPSVLVVPCEKADDWLLMVVGISMSVGEYMCDYII